MTVRRFACVLMACGFLIAPVAAWAQTTQAGTIAGVVRDASGAVLPGVTCRGPCL